MAEREHEFVQLARATIEEYTRTGRMTGVDRPLSAKFDREAGVFVSIKKNGSLRGCIGTIEPTRDNLAEEIISNAISAASRDPRFPPVREEELPGLNISVDVLNEPEKISGIDDLDPDEYGVIVERGNRRGLLLPRLEGIDSAREQVEIARRKAGIPESTEVDLYRFKVERYT